MSQAAEAAPATPPASNKQLKGIKDIFRSLSPSPAPEAHKNAEGEKKKEDNAVDIADNAAASSQKPTAKATAGDKKEAAAMGTTIAAEWDAVIDDISHEAGKKKDKKNDVFEMLRRMTSKDGKSSKPKSDAATPDDSAEVVTSTPPPVLETPGPSGPTKQRKNSLEILPGSNTLGRRIQTLLSNVPPFYHTDAAPDDSNKPRPPITDAKLLSFLSSSAIMNGVGTSPEGTDTPPATLTIDGATTSPKNARSVWSVLDRLVPYSQPKDGSEDDDDPETSVMLCAPLIPDEGSTVTLAKSKVIEVQPQDQQVQDIEGILPKVVAKGVFSALWPEKFKLGMKKKRKDSVDVQPGEGPKPPLAGSDSNVGTGGAAVKESKQVKVWIPSKTKVSLQVAWWGFRIWLPPPVMLILDDKTLEAAKRAAMVTAALTWLVSHIPSTGLPPQLAVAVNLLKAIVPLLGYVGGFIAWSWSQVKSFDQGKGVVLSATWLLPVALVPGAWEDPEVPAPEPAPSDPPRSDPPAGDNPVPAPPGDRPGPVEPAHPPEEAKFKFFGGSDAGKKKAKDKGKAKA